MSNSNKQISVGEQLDEGSLAAVQGGISLHPGDFVPKGGGAHERERLRRLLEKAKQGDPVAPPPRSFLPL